MPNPFLEQLDDETKSQVKAAIAEAINAGIPAEQVAKFVSDNGERIFRRKLEQNALSIADPRGEFAEGLLSFIEPNAMNAIALPASMVTGPLAGKLVAKTLGSSAIKRLAVRFVGDPTRRSVLFSAARKEGLTEAFGAMVRIKEEPAFLVSLGRAVGFSMPFATTDAIEAVNDERSPAGAFGTSLGVFTALDLTLTRMLPGVGHTIAKAARRRISEDMFRKTAFGEAALGAESVLRDAFQRAKGAAKDTGAEVVDEMADRLTTLTPLVQSALRKMTQRDVEAVRSTIAANKQPRALLSAVTESGRHVELTPDVQDALRIMTEADMNAIRNEGSTGFHSFAESVQRAHNSIRIDDPKASAAIEAAIDEGISSGLIDNSPASQTLVAAMKGRSIEVPASIAPAVNPQSVGARPEASKLASAIEAPIPQKVGRSADEIAELIEATPYEEVTAATEPTALDVIRAKKGDAVRVMRPDGSVQSATIEAVMPQHAHVRLESGSVVLVEHGDILRPIAEPTPLPRPRVAIAQTDAEIFETGFATKITRDFEKGTGPAFNPQIVAQLPENSRALFPTQSLIGRSVVMTEDMLIHPPGTRGVKLVQGENFIIGNENFVRREGTGRPRVDYRAHVYRIDPETNIPHIIRSARLRDLNQHGMQLSEAPFHGTDVAASEAMADINARIRVLAASLPRTEAARLFFADAKAAEGKDIAALIATTEHIPTLTRTLISRLKFNRGVIETQARKGLHVSGLGDVSVLEDVLTGPSATRRVATEALDPTGAMNERIAAEQMTEKIDRLRRLTRISEGLTPRKKERAAMLVGKSSIDDAEAAELDEYRAAARGLKPAERMEKKKLEEQFGTYDQIEKLRTQVNADITDSITRANIEGPVVVEGEAHREYVTSGAVAKSLARIDSPIKRHELEAFGNAESVRANRFATFLDHATDFATDRGLELRIDFNQDAGSKKFQQLLGKFNLVYQGRTVRSYESGAFDDMIRYLDQFDPNDPHTIEKIMSDLGDIGPRPSGGC